MSYNQALKRYIKKARFNECYVTPTDLPGIVKYNGDTYIRTGKSIYYYNKLGIALHESVFGYYPPNYKIFSRDGLFHHINPKKYFLIWNFPSIRDFYENSELSRYAILPPTKRNLSR